MTEPRIPLGIGGWEVMQFSRAEIRREVQNSLEVAIDGVMSELRQRSANLMRRPAWANDAELAASLAIQKANGVEAQMAALREQIMSLTAEVRNF